MKCSNPCDMPFDTSVFSHMKPIRLYEVWHHGRMIGRTQASSPEQAVNFVLYRVGLIGYLTAAEMKAVEARAVA